MFSYITNFILYIYLWLQLAIRDSRIASQFTVIANHFFLFLINSQINEFVHFILYFAHEFIQEMFLNNFYKFSFSYSKKTFFSGNSVDTIHLFNICLFKH